MIQVDVMDSRVFVCLYPPSRLARKFLVNEDEKDYFILYNMGTRNKTIEGDIVINSIMLMRTYVRGRLLRYELQTEGGNIFLPLVLFTYVLRRCLKLTVYYSIGPLYRKLPGLKTHLELR